MFWTTMQIWMKKQSIANVFASLSSVKNEATSSVIAAVDWLITIQVFRLPYSMFANF